MSVLSLSAISVHFHFPLMITSTPAFY